MCPPTVTTLCDPVTVSVCCDELWASSAQTTNLGMKWILWAQVQKLLMLGGHSLNLLLTRRELGGLLMLLVGFMCREL